jgi:hypothetical protein
MEKIYKINAINILGTFVRVRKLPALLPNATPLVSRFFAEISKERQRYAVVNLKNNIPISPKFADVYSNSK